MKKKKECDIMLLPKNKIGKGKKKMARSLKQKKLVNTKLAANYGGWMYCTNCNKNIGYLCYVTYDQVQLDYTCNCGSKGSAFLEFEDSVEAKDCDQELITIKNRMCCPQDESPLITMLSKNVRQYELKIACKACGKMYSKKEEENGL